MNKITKGILSSLGAINYIFKLFSPVLIAFTVNKVFNLTGFQKYFLIALAFLTVIYEIIKVAGIDNLINIIKNALNKHE